MMTDTLPLYVNEKDLAARIGVGEDKWRSIRPALIAAGLPSADPITGMRYWPSVRAFFDRINGHGDPRAPLPAPFIEDGKENPDALKASRGRSNRPQHRPAA